MYNKSNISQTTCGVEMYPWCCLTKMATFQLQFRLLKWSILNISQWEILQNWKEKAYLVYFFTLWYQSAAYCTLFIWIIIVQGYDERLGWMGFWSDMAAIVSCLIIGVTIDKFHTHQLTAIILNAASMIIWCTFIVVLTTLDQVKTFSSLK